MNGFNLLMDRSKRVVHSLPYCGTWVAQTPALEAS